MSCGRLLENLTRGAYDETLRTLYALDGKEESLEKARERAVQTVEKYRELYGEAEGPVLFSGPGRTEIGGNHTDHQQGHVLCGSVDLDMLACAAPNGTDTIRICSEGYPPFAVDLARLEPVSGEEGTSVALTRGVAAGIAALGHTVGGFDAYVTSNVLSGSGLSSSAAYEVLMGNIMSHFFCSGSLDPITIAKIGQMAENKFFGKPCGLMDQMGSSVGGAVAIDFEHPADPKVKAIPYRFAQSGHALCIIDTASSHDDLTDEYAAIPREMGKVAAQFGREHLRQVGEADFRAAIPELRKTCGDRAVLRAMHFYSDDRLAQEEAGALEDGDFEQFLTLIAASGNSSVLRLQNIWPAGATTAQAVALSLAAAQDLLEGEGAVRVHGGGFAGTIQAFVPNGRLERFKSGMEAILGPGRCHVLHIRPIGGCVVAE